MSKNCVPEGSGRSSSRMVLQVTLLLGCLEGLGAEHPTWPC